MTGEVFNPITDFVRSDIFSIDLVHKSTDVANDFSLLLVYGDRCQGLSQTLFKLRFPRENEGVQVGNLVFHVLPF